MKRLFLWLILSTVFLHCEDKTDWFPKPPELISLSETSGKEGETLVITGKHFSSNPADNVVLFNDVQATITTAAKTTLTIIVPAGEGQVMVRVATKSLIAKKKLSFTYLVENVTPENPEEPGNPETPANPENPETPVTPGGPEPGPVVEVTSISPTTGIPGISITIVGQNFSATPAQNIVRFGNASATVTAASATSLTVTVPAGTGSVAVSVSVNGSTAVNKPAFTYIQPTVTNLSPNTSGAGVSIIITGTNFSSTKTQNIVLFGNTSATVTAASPTSLTVTVPPGTGSVAVSVSVNGSTAANTPQFTYAQAPIVTNISPASGPNETTITINGQNFSTTVTENIVLVNGISVPVITATPTQLTIKAPSIPVDYDHACPTEVEVSVRVYGQEAVNKPSFEYRNPLNASAIVFAGDPIQSGSADALGTSARFDFPKHLTMDDNGNLYVSDRNGIRKITPGGNVSTIVTSGSNPDVDSQGNLYYVNDLELYKRTPGGNVTLIATLPYRVEDLTVDNSGNVYILIDVNQDIHYIQKISPNGTVTILAGTVNSGSADGLGANARFYFSSNAEWWDIEFDEANNLLYVIDNRGLRKVTMDGNVTTVHERLISALTIDPTGGVYINTYSSCKLQPNGDCCGVYDTDFYMAVNAAGEVYFAEFGKNAIYKVVIP